MITIIVATAIALAITGVITIWSRRIDPAQLSEPRTSFLSLGVQIICGNCSGEGEIPQKTYLDRYGNCEQCGGHSYVLAANRGVYVQQMIQARAQESESQAARRVLPFEVPLSRVARAKRVAV
ncbi:MAG TPA: hypothetical protein VNO14_08935 [Blastocatellia bacterium]|nr:hypothetical protein [Blastocatellia bacterium]